MTNGSRQEVWSPIRQTLDGDRLECFSRSLYGATEVGCLRNLRGRYFAAPSFQYPLLSYNNLQFYLKHLASISRVGSRFIEGYFKEVVAIKHEGMTRGGLLYR